MEAVFLAEDDLMSLLINLMSPEQKERANRLAMRLLEPEAAAFDLDSTA